MRHHTKFRCFVSVGDNVSENGGLLAGNIWHANGNIKRSVRSLVVAKHHYYPFVGQLCSKVTDNILITTLGQA